MHITLKWFLNSTLYLFAFIGFFLSAGYVATVYNITDTEGVVDTQAKVFTAIHKEDYITFPLAHTPEWIAFRKAIAKDIVTIAKVSKLTGVPERLLVSVAVPEQMRLFHSDRALFKKVFEPLKILGSQSQFSWGLFGIKDDTARAVETNLRTPSSPYYLGKRFETMLSFAGDSIDEERYQRITSTKDHTYTYLYTALYIKQIEAAWNKKGFSVITKPDIVATLWNLGFAKSQPKKDPESGGSVLTINGKDHSFGSLAYDFYYSDEMIELFPRKD